MEILDALFKYDEPVHTDFDKPSSLVGVNVPMDYKELDEQIMLMIERREGKWSCKVCGKTDRKQNIQQHVEGRHIEGGAHPCNHIHCGRKLGSRKALRNHIVNHHK